jgi:hypothetical protein
MNNPSLVSGSGRGGVLKTAVLNLEAEQTAPGKAFVWLSFVLVFFAAGGVFSYQVNMNGGAALANQMIAVTQYHEHGWLGGVVLPAVAFITLLYFIKDRLWGVLQASKYFVGTTAMALIAVASAAWSQAPLRSLEFGISYLIGTLFVYYLLLEYDTERVMDLIMATGWWVTVLFVIVMVFFHSIGMSTMDGARAGAWQGIFMDRVTSAKCLSFLLTPALFRFRRSHGWKNVLYVLLMGLFILMAKAVTAYAAMLFYVFVVFCIFVARKYFVRSAIAGFFAASLLLVSGSVYLLSRSDVFLQLFSRDTTYSGRTYIWQLIVHFIGQRPILGYGFNAFWLGMQGPSGQIITASDWRFGYAHNMVLEVLVQFGLVGVLLLGLVLARAIYNAMFCLVNDTSSSSLWYVSLLPLTLLYNSVEETIWFANALHSMLFVIMCCGLELSRLRIISTNREANRYDG